MRSRFVRRLLTCTFIAAVGGALLLVAIVGLGVWVGTDAGNRWLATRIESTLSGWILTEGTIEVGELGLDLRSGLLLRDFRLVSPAGRPVIQVGELVADLDVAKTLWSLAINVPHLRGTGVVVDITTGPDGVSDLTKMFGGPQPGDPDAAGRPLNLPVDFSAPDVVLDGVHVRTTNPNGVAFQLAGARARASLTGEDDILTIAGLTLGAQLVRPGPIPVTADGGFAYGASGLGFDQLRIRVPYGDVEADGLQGAATDLVVRIAALDARALQPIAANAGIGGSYSGVITAKGPRSALVVTADVKGEGETSAGLGARSELDLTKDPPAYTASAALVELHLEEIYTPLGQPIVIDGLVRVEGRGFSFPDDLTLSGTWVGGRQEVYGQVFESVDATFAIDKGVLTMKDTKVRGIVGDITAQGPIDLVNGPMAVTVHAALDPEMLAELGAEGVGGDCVADSEVTADLKAAPLAIRAPGTITCAPFRYTDDVIIARLTGGFDATVAGADVGVAIDLSGQRIEAYGSTAAALSFDDLYVHVPAGGGPIEVDGTIGVDAIAYGNAATVATTTTELSIRSGDTLAVDARTTLGEHTIGGRPGTAGVVTIAMRDDTIGFTAALEDLGRAVLDTGGTFDMATREIVVDHALVAPTPRIVFADRGPWSLTLIEGGFTDAAVALTGTLGPIELLGIMSASGTSNATLTVEALQLDVIAELFPDQASDLSGTLDLDMALTGGAVNPTVEVSVLLTGLFFPDAIRWLDVRGKVRLADQVLSPDLELAIAGDPFGLVTGKIQMTGGLTSPDPAWDQPAEVAVTIRPTTYAQLATMLPALEGTTLPDGVLSAALRAQGPLTDPDLTLSGVTEITVRGWTSPGRVELVVERTGDELTLYADLREGLAARASILGDAKTRMGEVIAWATGHGPEVNLDDYTLWANDFTVNALLLGVPVDSLATAVAAPIDMGGELVGGFVVTGSPMAPTVSGAANWLDPVLGGQPLEGGYLELVPSAAYGYDLAMALAFDSGSFEVKGSVPIEVDLATEDREQWANGDLDLAITGDEVPLAVVAAFDQGMEQTAGFLAVEGHVGGSVFDPEPTLTLSGDDIAFVYAPLNLRVQDGEFAFAFDRSRVEIDIAASTQPQTGAAADRTIGGLEGNKPRLAVKGSTAFEDWAPTDVSAEITFRDGAWLSAASDLKLRVNGDLAVGGTWPALNVGGAIDVARMDVVLDAAAFASAAPLEPDPLIEISRPGVELQPPKPDEPPLYGDFVVDVALDLGRNLDLDMAMPFVESYGQLGAMFTTLFLDARLGGQVDLRLEGGEPSLVGEIEVIDGHVQVLSSRLELEEGTITFSGGDPAENANLDLSATMDVETASLDMHIRGTPYAPEIELHSDEYQDETAQITMLLTGEVPGDMTAEEGASALAGIFVGGMLGGGLPISIDSDGAATVEFPVSPKVRASSMINPFPDPTEDSYSLSAEWSVSRQVVAVGVLGDVNSSADVFWEIRF